MVKSNFHLLLEAWYKNLITSCCKNEVYRMKYYKMFLEILYIINNWNLWFSIKDLKKNNVLRIYFIYPQVFIHFKADTAFMLVSLFKLCIFTLYFFIWLNIQSKKHLCWIHPMGSKSNHSPMVFLYGLSEHRTYYSVYQ